MGMGGTTLVQPLSLHSFKYTQRNTPNMNTPYDHSVLSGWANIGVVTRNYRNGANNNTIVY